MNYSESKLLYASPEVGECIILEDESILTSLDGGTIGNYDLVENDEE